MKNSILLLLGLGIAVNIFFATPFITYAIPDDGNRGCPEGKVFSSQLNNGRGGCVLAFQPLVGIPFVDTTNPNTSLPQYINALYLASISIAAFLAVIKIIFAGVKYMLSDVVPTKEAAKKDMYGALLGLLIVVGAVLILNTINPQLTGLDALSKIKGVSVDMGGNAPDKCVQIKIDYLTGKEICVATEGETCDLSRAGTFCDCGQIISYTTVEPGFRCDNPTSDSPPPADPNDPNCTYTEGYATCPCGTIIKPTGSYTFNCISAISNIDFRGETIDTSITYTINDPADPDIGIMEDAPNHGKTVTIIGVNNSMIQYATLNGEQGWVGCSLLLPKIPGC